MAVFLIGTVMTFRKPIWGIYLYIFSFYFSPHDTWWADLVPDLRYLQIAAIVTLTAAFLHGSFNAQRTAWLDATYKLFAVFVALIWITSFWEQTGDWQILGRELFAKHLVITTLMIVLITNFEEVKRVILANIIGGLWLGWQAYGKQGPRLEGLAGALADANTLGMHMACVALLAGLMLLSGRGYYRWISFASLPLILNTVVLTGSRGAFVGLVAGGIASAFLIPKKLRAAFIAAGILGTILFVMLTDDKFAERIMSLTVFQSGSTEEVNQTMGGRVEIIEAGWNIFLDHPQGTGYKGTVVLSPLYMSEELLTGVAGARSRSAHNSFMAVLVDFGMIGLFLYLAMFVRSFFAARRVCRNGSPEMTELGALMAAAAGVYSIVVISGQATNYYYAEIQYWMLALIVVMAKLASEQTAALPDPIRDNEGINTAVVTAGKLLKRPGRATGF